MLKTLKIKNFRCFAETEKVRFAPINVFIGANNAGKSSFLSATELLLRSGEGGGFGEQTPVRFALQPEYASFSSVLRKGWSRSEQKATDFVFDAEWSGGKSDTAIAWSRMSFEGNAQDDLTYVSRATYGRILPGKTRRKTDLDIYASSPGGDSSGVRYATRKPIKSAGVFFLNGFPLVHYRERSSKKKSVADQTMSDFQDLVINKLQRTIEVFVIRPFRPIPRPLYVLDDP